MRFEEPTRWELFLEGFHDFLYAWDSYGTNEFWEALSSGWYDDYIYPYDDIFYGHKPSPERKLRLAQEPYVMFLPKEDYDFMVKMIENPEPPSQALIDLFNRKVPWEEK